MKQPAMYSYTAFHRYIYQIKFNTQPLLTEHILTILFISQMTDHTQL